MICFMFSSTREDLAVVNMVKNHKLAKSLLDCSFGEFLRRLKYNSEWNERELIAIDHFFPSSKTCNKCKFVNQDLTLKDRIWTCPNCGAELDRGINASENILEQGLIIYSGCVTQSELKEKREEALPLGDPKNRETTTSLVSCSSFKSNENIATGSKNIPKDFFLFVNNSNVGIKNLKDFFSNAAKNTHLGYKNI